MTKRRDFLKAASFTGMAAAMAETGCQTVERPIANARSAMGLHAPALDEVRVGVIGVGGRGSYLLKSLCNFPKTKVVAVCDVREDRVAKSAADVVAAGQKDPAKYFGSEEVFRKMCERPDVNLVYVCTPWEWHAQMALYAMQCGKHVCVEVPMAMTVEDCWRLVKMAEKTRLHCMMLENCCYGYDEMFALNLCRKGVLGELVHGEAAYIHDLRSWYSSGNDKGEAFQTFRFKWFQRHTGNLYPTHGLGPVCQYMGINRGDRMEAVASMSTLAFGFGSAVADKYGKDSPQAKTAQAIKMGDMNTSIIRTRLGKTIMVQYSLSCARPYSRLNLISGTKGTLSGFSSPMRVALDPNTHDWMGDKDLQELKAKYVHPLWDKNGAMAQKSGGHGGMDYLMEYRLIHCLLNGLPLDIDVYDSATWSSLVELSERSVLNGGSAVEVPDFTRGAWRTAQPLGIAGC